MDYQPNQNTNQPQEEDNLDIKKIFFQILGNWYWFALSIFVGLFIAYMVNRYSEKIYSVQSSLIVRDDESMKGFTGAENLIQGLRLTKNTKSVQNEIGILKSYTLAYQSLSKLEEFKITYVLVGRRRIVKSDLYTRSPFKVYLDTALNNLQNVPVNVTILSKEKYLLEIAGGHKIKKELHWGEPFNSEGFNFTIKLRNPDKFTEETIGQNLYFTVNNLNILANKYRGKVTVDLNDKKGSILILNTKGSVAEQETDYLNTLMQTYIQKGLDEKNKIAENTINFIDAQLSDMEDSLRRSERSLQEFRSTNKVIDLSREGTIIYEKIRNLQSEKGVAELKGRYYQYLDKYVKEKKELKDIVAPSAMGIDDSQLALILADISRTYLDRITLMQSVSSENPGLNNLDLRLETLRRTLEEKVSSLIEVNNVTISEINRRVADIEKEMIQIPVNERLLIDYEREFNLINKMYSYLLEKRAEAAIAKASNIADNRILDYALPENATIVKPNRKLNYMVGFAAGAIIPLAIILIFSFFNTAITDLKDISRYTSVTLLGTLGHNHFESDLPVAANPKSTLAESFRGLRTNLEYMLRDPGKKVITVTSTVSGEGKTFVAANLAVVLALTGKKVLLVGLDLRKPKLHNLFDVSLQLGLSTYLIGKDKFESVVYKTKYENLFFSPSGPIPPNPAELIGTSRMEEFIETAKGQFDYIVIDTPPVAIVTDALIASRFSNIMLFIVRFNYSDREVLKLVDSIRSSDETKSIALVVNDLTYKKRYGYAYGYGFRYGYQYSYGYQYGYSNSRNGEYYSDDRPPLTWKDKIFRLFS